MLAFNFVFLAVRLLNILAVFRPMGACTRLAGGMFDTRRDADGPRKPQG
eukprot:SAG11_NODE_410_length_9703_cov_3.284777_15_plen_49_part_00